MAHGDVHYLRLTGDRSKSKGFYGKLFSWTFQDEIQVGGKYYTPWVDGTGPGGDVVAPDPGEAVDWFPFVEVTSIDATILLAEANGGKKVLGKTDWVRPQSYAIIKDPSGALIGLWQLK